MNGPVRHIRAAESAADIALAKALCQAYADSLDFDLGFQDFAREMADFPGKYAPPAGALLLGDVARQTLGVVALRALGDGICEMKRLYVLPDARGSGLGRALAEAIVAEGQRLGYRAMRLDTIEGHHDAAIRLYERLGFRQVAAYYDNPIPGTRYMEYGYPDNADRPSSRRSISSSEL